MEIVKKADVGEMKKWEPQPISIEVSGDQFFVRLANELSKELAPAQLGTVYTKLQAWTSNIEAFTNNVKSRLMELVKKHGTKITDKGSLEYACGGNVFTARPTRTGYAVKKVEALLRAKKAQPSAWMDTEITFKLNEQKLGAALQAGILTQAELETCRDGRDDSGEQRYALLVKS